MADYPSAFLVYLLTASLCILPGLIAGVFGQGGFMVAAALCSFVAFMFVTLTTQLFVFAPIGTSKFWLSLSLPLRCGALCAWFAVQRGER